MTDLPLTLPSASCDALLGESLRRIWCGDRDVTGRYVCRQIRDHGGPVHIGRTDVGGLHEWPDRHAESDPVGTVRLCPGLAACDPDAPRVLWNGRAYVQITGTELQDPGRLAAQIRTTWPLQSLAELGVVLGQKVPVDVAVLCGFKLGQRDAITSRSHRDTQPSTVTEETR